MIILQRKFGPACLAQIRRGIISKFYLKTPSIVGNLSRMHCFVRMGLHWLLSPFSEHLAFVMYSANQISERNWGETAVVRSQNVLSGPKPLFVVKFDERSILGDSCGFRKKIRFCSGQIVVCEDFVAVWAHKFLKKMLRNQFFLFIKQKDFDQPCFLWHFWYFCETFSF